MIGRAIGREASVGDGTGGAGADGVGTEIAVVVVNYESGSALLRCVEGWQADGAAEVVIVDNGSRDGSVDQVRARYPDLEVVVPGGNLGYGSAANRGVAAAGAPRLLVCNSDVEVRPGALATLSGVLDREPGCALVGPLIRTTGGDRYPSARKFPSLVDAGGHALFGIFAPGNRFTRSYQQADLGDRHDGPVVVDWLSGACFLVRRPAFEQVGGFDEAYFMYAEDVDLCWRLHDAGWTVSWVPDAEVTHLQGVSTDHHPYQMILEHHRSLLRFALRTSHGWRRALLPLVALGIGVRACLAVVARVSQR
ncbi:MAG TPA: glycosyltransferase family 2 protein [Acidimicrobiales bacterium]|nr:glycosyltransferase family 2 protein [Acidimicrobiales bacterium]